MFTTLAFVTALTLAPAQAQLALTNDQVTYGYLGAPRPDTKFLPGDIFFLTFDIENVKVNDNGEVLYSMGMEVRDSNGKQVFAQKPQDKKAVNTLGGTRLPAFAHVFCGSDQLPGEYTVRVAVTDRVSKQEKTIERKFEVLKPDFGLVQVGLSIDSDMQMPAPAVGVAGQFVYVNFAAVGFERDKAKKQPNVAAEMRVLDDSGQPVLSNPFKGEAAGNVGNDKLVPMQFLLALNRTGKFQVELKATDRISKKTAKVVFPITVVASK